MTPLLSEAINVIKDKSPAPLEKVWIDDLVIGIFFTGVKLSTGHGGCAFTPIGNSQRRLAVLRPRPECLKLANYGEPLFRKLLNMPSTLMF